MRIVTALTAIRAPAVRRRHWTGRWREGCLAAGEPLLRIGISLRLGVGGPPEHAAIEQPAVGCHGLEEEAIAGDLRDHEMVLGNSCFIEAASAEVVQIPAAAARHEIADAPLWRDPL